MYPPFNERGSVYASVGGCAPVWEGASQYGRVCPSVGGCARVCEVWVSLSHVLMMDTQVHLSVCSYIIAGCIGHVAKAYVAKTSCCY